MMMNRRTLLLGSMGLAASSLLTGCSQAENPLQVQLLEGGIPPEVLNSFQKSSEFPVQFQALGQMPLAFQQLQRWQQTAQAPSSDWLRWLPWRQTDAPSAVPHRLVSLGDYWLQSAIAQNLIEPLALSDEQLAPLPLQWQQFVTRDKQGQLPAPTAASDSVSLWAAPYKVQTLMIVYRHSQVRQLTEAVESGRALPDSSPSESPVSVEVNRPFQRWQDLLQPSLRGRIALPDHPNLVIGLLQKMQTGRFNAGFDSSVSSSASVVRLVEKLREQFAAPFAELNQQVRTYDSTTALKALINEDVQVAVAWSGDVQLALQRYRDLRVAVPEEGSLLSADMWVRPKGSDLSAAAAAWIDFCWQLAPATQISVSGRGLSPVFLSEAVLAGTSEQVSFPEALASRRQLAEIMQKSEPLLPLPKTMQAAYFTLWEQLRARRTGRTAKA